MNDAEQNAVVAAVLSWWRMLFPASMERSAAEEGTAGDARGTRGNPAARARLRRCHDVVEALLEPETHELLRRTRKAGSTPAMDSRIALLAMVLPSITPARSARRFARVLGETADGRYPNREKGERPIMSESRFGTLIRALAADDEPDRMVRSLRRAERLLGDAHFDVGAFVRDILFLSDETRRRWVYQYWQTDWRPSAPAGDAEDRHFEPETDK